jgi:hypothetical protein
MAGALDTLRAQVNPAEQEGIGSPLHKLEQPGSVTASYIRDFPPGQRIQLSTPKHTDATTD